MITVTERPFVIGVIGEKIFFPSSSLLRSTRCARPASGAHLVPLTRQLFIRGGHRRGLSRPLFPRWILIIPPKVAPALAASGPDTREPASSYLSQLVIPTADYPDSWVTMPVNRSIPRERRCVFVRVISCGQRCEWFTLTTVATATTYFSKTRENTSDSLIRANTAGQIFKYIKKNQVYHIYITFEKNTILLR